MSLAILPRHQDQVGLAYPVALGIYSQHVSQAELLPWQKRHLDQVSEFNYVIYLGFALEVRAVKPRLGCPS